MPWIWTAKGSSIGHEQCVCLSHWELAQSWPVLMHCLRIWHPGYTTCCCHLCLCKSHNTPDVNINPDIKTHKHSYKYDIIPLQNVSTIEGNEMPVRRLRTTSKSWKNTLNLREIGQVTTRLFNINCVMFNLRFLRRLSRCLAPNILWAFLKKVF